MVHVDDELTRPPGTEAFRDALDPATAATLLTDVGFIESPDLPNRPGRAFLLVAMRQEPTLRHYDPELVEYWAPHDATSVWRSLSRTTRVPVATTFSWGPIRIVDRLDVANEYLGFGGDLAVDRIGGVVVAVFTSPAPLLRRGGHSQGWDPGAASVGAFFARLRVAADSVPGFAAPLAAATPLGRYAAFLIGLNGRFRRSELLRTSEPQLASLIADEERRLRVGSYADWLAGEALVRQLPS